MNAPRAMAALAALMLMGCGATKGMMSLLAHPTHQGTAEPDKMKGSPQDDVMVGGEDDDVLEGGRGDDVLVGGPGRDRLVGGPGEDTFVLDASSMHQPDVVVDLQPSEDRIVLLPTLLKKLPVDVEKRVRIDRGELQVQVGQSWVPLASGLDEGLSVRVNPRRRDAALVLEVRF